VSDDEQAVLRANRAFYDAFTRGDLAAMEALWSRRAPVTCVHPGWDALRSREAVVRSWRLIFQGPRPPRVQVEWEAAYLLGNVAYVVCHERLSDSMGEVAGTLVATNVFVREQGAWRLVHHHAGSMPMEDAREAGDEEDEGRGRGGMLN
jgi:ketosteroid isomerase-like protein